MRTKSISVLATLVAVLSGAIVIASGPAAGRSRQISREADSQSCPRHYHRPPFTDYPALHRMMVPRGPGQAVLCRYAGLNAPHPQALVGSGIVPGRDADLRRVVRIYNALPPPPAGPTACPADSGREITVKFRYRDRGSDFVNQELTGCRVGTNGHRSAWTWSKRGRSLLQLLRELSGA